MEWTKLILILFSFSDSSLLVRKHSTLHDGQQEATFNISTKIREILRTFFYIFVFCDLILKTAERASLIINDYNNNQQKQCFSQNFGKF